MELVRQKNVATIITFPIVDADGDVVSSAAGLDSEIDTWTDTVAPNGFADCTNECTEVGTSGIYYLSLTQSEMNADYIYIQVKTTTSGAKTQHILIRTTIGDPLNVATTGDGSEINVSSGAIDAVTTVTTTTTNTDMRGTDGANTTVPDVAGTAPTAAEIQAEMEENGTSILDSINDKLPTNYIMGSSDQTDKDDDIDAIKAVTDNQAETDIINLLMVRKSLLLTGDTQGKLPTNYIMGSSVQTDKDDDVDAIKAVTDVIPNSGALTDIDTGVNNIEAKLPSKSYLSGSADVDGGIDTTEAAVIQSECNDALNAYDPPTKTELDTAEASLTTEIDANETKIDALNDLSQSDILSDATPFAGANVDAAISTRATPAQVDAEVDEAIENYHLDHLLAVDYDPADKPGVATALLNEMVESDGGVSQFTANALEQAPTGGTTPQVLVDTTIASITSQTIFTLTAGSNDDDAYNDQAIVLYDASDSDYPSVRIVTDYVQATKTITLDSAPDFTIIAGDGIKIFVTAPGTVAPTAAQVADAVLQESVDDHKGTADSLAEHVDDIQVAVAALNDISVADILGGTIDVLNLQDTLKRILAWAAGEFTVNGNVVTYLEQDDATAEMVQTYTGLQRTVA